MNHEQGQSLMSIPDMNDISGFVGRWRNEQGSEMVLRKDNEIISGKYITAVGDDRVVGTQHDLIGRANGDLIGFVVTWPASESMTAWVGRLVCKTGEADTIHTVWHLVRKFVKEQPQRLAQPWESFLTYTSIFTRIREPDIDNAVSRL